MNAQNMANGMNDVHNLIDALVQQAAHEGWEDREVYSIDIIRMQNELREKYAALQQQLAAAREALQVAEAESARYRAMRHAGWGKGASRDLWFDILRAETPDQLDAAIDATLQRDRQS